MSTKWRLILSKWLRPCKPLSYKGYIGRGLLSLYYGYIFVGSLIMAPLCTIGLMSPCDGSFTKDKTLIRSAKSMWLLLLVSGSGTIGTILGMRALYYIPAIQILTMSVLYTEKMMYLHVLPVLLTATYLNQKSFKEEKNTK